MIVKPQINNLRLILAFLTILLLALGYYSYESYKTLKNYQKYIVHENDRIEQELGDLIVSYHNLEIENDTILEELELTKSKIFSVLDSIQNSKPNITLVTKHKKELLILKEENKRILNLVEALDGSNNLIKNKNYSISKSNKNELSVKEQQISIIKT